ncbi:succinate dehydrogenase assembly factor 4, mitochondrial [Daphnia magna]|uniref:succinate dehydrogenase assembly factor 4, mitochondrial n=1 Tax=Daphnia magna TaxID=35525 RepID=UPI001E1BDB98|nr:succinate dehydrogenase assembly factor 4, mitochondrial [Daphnia magna]
MNSGTSSICVLKSLLRQTARLHHVSFFSTSSNEPSDGCASKAKKPRRVKTPIGKLDEIEEGQHPYQEKEPLKPWPNNTNPTTGEVGGPKGPEPTRYGDWERKGRVSDF